MAIEAVTQLAHDSGQKIVAYELRNVDFLLGLTIPPDGKSIETHIRLKNARDSLRNMASGYEFSIYTYGKTLTFEVCRGVIQIIDANERSTQMDGGRTSKEAVRIAVSKVEEVLKTCTKQTSGQALYSRLHRLGYHFGESFHRIKDVRYNDAGEAVGNLTIFEDPVASTTVIHPATLDGILQMMLPATVSGGDTKTSTMIPTHVDRLWLSRTQTSSQLQAHVSLHKTSARSNESSICSFEPNSGHLFVDAEGIEATVVANGATEVQNASDHPRRLCFGMIWKPDISFLSNDQLYEILAQKQSNPEETSQMWRDIHAFIVVPMGVISRDLRATDIPSASPHLVKQLA